MKAIYIIALLFIIHSASATNYYFSAVSGNDSRSVTEAQDPATPWKTLDKLNSFFSSLKPGDGVYLKRDETYVGSIIAKQSGSAALPITIGAYGTGNRPVITSLVTLTGWVATGGGIWESSTVLNSMVNIVLLNNKQQEMGRYPNSNDSNAGYLNFESHSGKTSITDNDLNTAVNWTGAELVTRPRHWILNRSVITGQSGQTISYTTTSPYEPYDNYGYFIQNSIKTLDKVGEWYYNPSTKKISAFFGSENPSSALMEAATTTNDLLYSNGYSNLVFDNLAVKGSNSSGIFINGGANIFIQNCDVRFSGLNGALVHAHTNLHFENTTISNSNNNGIDMEYSVLNAVIKNNKILNTALIPGLLQNGDGTGLAIYSNGDGASIEGNELRATGFIGMTFYGNNVVIKNNVIDSFCFVKDDGGGLYTHGGATIPVNRKLINNIIRNGLGAGPGSDQYDKRSVSGIYIDANSYNVEIIGNTVTTSYQGIFLHSTNGITVKSNSVYNNDRQLTIVQRPGSNSVRNSAISQNIFFSKNQDQWASYLMTGADDIALFGTFDSNYYARPIDDRVDIYNSRVTGGAVLVENFDLAEWKKKYNKDAASLISAKQVTPYKVNSLTGPNKFINGGDFTGDIKGVSGSSCALSLNTSGVMDGGCLQVIPSATGSSVYMKIGAVTAGKKYFVSYSVRGSENRNMSITASLKQSASPFGYLTKVQMRMIGTTRTQNEMVFSPSVSEASALVLFKVDVNSKYYLDNIKVYEADAVTTNPDDSIRLVVNETNAVKVFSVPGNFMDVKGNTYSNNVSVQPYSSLILIQTSGAVAPNVPPVVNITAPLNNAAFTSSSVMDITADASDADGIMKVEFYNGSTLLGSDVTSPYSFSWNNVPAGNYSLTAKATDNNGLSTTSSIVTVSVATTPDPVPPQVNITSPAESAIFGAPAMIVINATASDNDGSITKVEFFAGTTSLGSDITAPYSFTWNSVAAGDYTLTAKATDNSGLSSTSSPVTISVGATANPVPPVVNITAPAVNATYGAPATINIAATATDANGTITRVEFYNGTTLLKTESSAPYNYSWLNVGAGTYSLTARATNNDGLVTTSAVRQVTVTATGLPVVKITSPTANATYSARASVTISATATDANGSISKVEFYNGTTLLNTQKTAPYSYSWQNVAAGNYSIKAKATDNQGNSTTSAAVAIKVVAPLVSRSTSTTDLSSTSGSAAAGNSAINSSPVDFNAANGQVVDGENLSGRLNLRLFPNPAVSTVAIYLEGNMGNKQKATLTIYSETGAVVKTYPVVLQGAKIDLDVAFLRAGSYILHVSGGNFSVSKKFVKIN